MEAINLQLGKYKKLIEKKKKLEEYFNSVDFEEEIENDTNLIKKENTYESMEIDITEYIKQVRSSYSFEDIKFLLEKENDKARINIINRLLIVLNAEILELNNLLLNEEDEDIKNDLIKLETIYDELIDYRDYEDVEEQDNNTDMKVVFLMSSEDKSFFEKDLESVPEEYYNDFIVLLESIKHGTFKQVKKFVNVRRDLYPFTEVKKYQTRIFFNKIDANTVLISGAMVKKVSSSKHYFGYLSNRSKILYNLDNDSMKNAINNEMFMNEEDAKYNRIVSLLRSNARGQ